MDIRIALEKEHSKTNTQRIANWIGNDPKRFELLMEIFFGGNNRITQRSAWVLNYCADTHPALFYPYLEKLIMHLKEDTHDAVRRNSLRVLQFLEIPPALHGHAAQICFDLLMDAKQAVAIKVFAMTVLANICEVEKELAQELRLIVEDLLPNGTPGIRSRGKKILQKLDRIQSSI